MSRLKRKRHGVATCKKFTEEKKGPQSVGRLKKKNSSRGSNYKRSSKRASRTLWKAASAGKGPSSRKKTGKNDEGKFERKRGGKRGSPEHGETSGEESKTGNKKVCRSREKEKEKEN